MPQASLSEKHQIAPAIVTLLGLYWQSDESPETRRLIADAWLDSLLQFEAAIVIESCREWWENHTKRPVLAEIVKLCRENRGLAAERAVRALPQPDDGVPPCFARDRDLVRTWARPEDEGDLRPAFQRRCDELAALKAKKQEREAELQCNSDQMFDLWGRSQGYADGNAALAAGRTCTEAALWVLAQAPVKLMPLAPFEMMTPRAKEERREERAIEVIDDEENLGGGGGMSRREQDEIAAAAA